MSENLIQEAKYEILSNKYEELKKNLSVCKNNRCIHFHWFEQVCRPPDLRQSPLQNSLPEVAFQMSRMFNRYKIYPLLPNALWPVRSCNFHLPKIAI